MGVPAGDHHGGRRAGDRYGRDAATWRTLTPRLSALLGGLAAAGLGNLGVCVTHHAYGNVLVLVWHVSIVVALPLMGGSAGRHVLSWQSLVEQTRRAVMGATR